MSGFVAGRGLTTGRHGSASLDVGGGFWGGRAQGQHVCQLGRTGNVVQLKQVAQSRDLPTH